MYIERNFNLPYQAGIASLGQLEIATATRDLLSSDMPVWQSLLLGFGAIAAVVFIAGGVQREAKHAKRTLGF